MMNFVRGRLVFLLVLGFWIWATFFCPVGVLAAPGIQVDAPQGCVRLDENGVPAGDGQVLSLGCLAQIVRNVVSLAFVFLGAVVLIFLLLGAIKFILSQGDAGRVKEARNMLTYALLGMAVVLGSFLIINTLGGILGLGNLAQTFSIYVGK